MKTCASEPPPSSEKPIERSEDTNTDGFSSFLQIKLLLPVLKIAWNNPDARNGNAPYAQADKANAPSSARPCWFSLTHAQASGRRGLLVGIHTRINRKTRSVRATLFFSIVRIITDSSRRVLSPTLVVFQFRQAVPSWGPRDSIACRAKQDGGQTVYLRMQHRLCLRHDGGL